MNEKKVSRYVSIILVAMVALLLSGCKSNEVVPVDENITYETAIKHVDSLDKGGRWLSQGIKEINQIKGLSQENRTFVNHHLFGLIKDKALRFDIESHKEFETEMKSKGITNDAIKVVENSIIRVSSPLNLHDGYWVGKIKPEGSLFSLIVINDMHIDAVTNLATVYAQSKMLGKVVAPAQINPGEFTELPNGDRVASHPDAVYLNGSGKELLKDDGTGSWWVKHSWFIGGEGYRNAELKPQEHYKEIYVEGDMLEDGVTMKIGDPEEEWGYNLRKPTLTGEKTTYLVDRYEFKDGNKTAEKVFVIQWKHKNDKSPFNGLKRSGPDKRYWNLIKGEDNVE